MQKVKFCDCVDIVGKAPKNFSGEKIYVSTGALDKNYIDFSQIEKINFASRPSRANLEVKADNIIFAKMYQTDKTLLIDEEKENYIYSTGFFAIRPKQQKITTKCLMYLIQSDEFIKQKDKYCSGATQKAITNEGLKKIEINIPPIEDQKEISERLDKVSELIEKRKEQIKKLDLLIKSRFLEMFGDLEIGTNLYPTKKLKELSTKISDGVHAKPEYMDTGRPFLSVLNINKGEIDFDNCKFVSEEAYQNMIKSTYPQKGDVLYTKVGATYGIPAYVDTDREFCLYVSVCLIKPKHDKINSRFLALQMKMPSIKHQADDRIKGIGVPDLHLNQISEFEIVCPPRELQDKFVDFAEKVDKLKKSVKTHLEKKKKKKKSLMQQYFG